MLVEGVHRTRFVKYGRILAAEYESEGRVHTGVYFKDKNGGGYYTPAGESLRRAFLKSPLEFTRISSTFSRGRRHPILGGVRPHLAVDYAAPLERPVCGGGRDGGIRRIQGRRKHGHHSTPRQFRPCTITVPLREGHPSGRRRAAPGDHSSSQGFRPPAPITACEGWSPQPSKPSCSLPTRHPAAATPPNGLCSPGSAEADLARRRSGGAEVALPDFMAAAQQLTFQQRSDHRSLRAGQYAADLG
jgi:hypothetical protein